MLHVIKTSVSVMRNVSRGEFLPPVICIRFKVIAQKTLVTFYCNTVQPINCKTNPGTVLNFHVLYFVLEHVNHIPNKCYELL